MEWKGLGLGIIEGLGLKLGMGARHGRKKWEKGMGDGSGGWEKGRMRAGDRSR